MALKILFFKKVQNLPNVDKNDFFDFAKIKNKICKVLSKT